MMSEQKVPRSVEQRIVIKFFVGENVTSAEINHRLQQQYREECLRRRGLQRVLVGKPEGKRPLGRPRRRWEDNIKTDLLELGGGCGDWMELAQDRDRWRALVSTVMNLGVPKMRGIS